MSPPDATNQEVENLKAALGLDKPAHVRLGIFMRDLAQGDLGHSIRSGDPVLELLASRVEPTLVLAILVQLWVIVIGIPLGIVAAWKQNTWVDRGAMLVAVVGFSVPGFWLGFMAMWLFGIKWGLLPAAGYVPIGEGFLPFIERLIMPTLVTGIIVMALAVRMTRGAMVEVLRADYIRTARSKGLGERPVLVRHALKSAAAPILTVVGLSFAGLITGIVVTESVFAIPGLGMLLVNAISARDYPMIQGFILMVAAVYVVVNLIVDILYAYLDPRIRYT